MVMVMGRVAALALGAASVALGDGAAYDGSAIGRFNANATNEDWAGHAVLALAFSDAAALDDFVGAPAQLELLYNIIGGSMGRFARAGAPFRVPCDRVVCACRCPCALPAPLLRMWSCKCLCT